MALITVAVIGAGAWNGASERHKRAGRDVTLRARREAT